MKKRYFAHKQNLPVRALVPPSSEKPTHDTLAKWNLYSAMLVSNYMLR